MQTFNWQWILEIYYEIPFYRNYLLILNKRMKTRKYNELEYKCKFIIIYLFIIIWYINIYV